MKTKKNGHGQGKKVKVMPWKRKNSYIFLKRQRVCEHDFQAYLLEKDILLSLITKINREKYLILFHGWEDLDQNMKFQGHIET